MTWYSSKHFIAPHPFPLNSVSILAAQKASSCIPRHQPNRTGNNANNHDPSYPRIILAIVACKEDDTRSNGHRPSRLTTETVKGTALALESVDNVEGSDGLALGVLGVGDGITNNTLEEGLEDTTGLLVNH